MCLESSSQRRSRVTHISHAIHIYWYKSTNTELLTEKITGHTHTACYTQTHTSHVVLHTYVFSHIYTATHLSHALLYTCVLIRLNICPHTEVLVSSQACRLVTWWNREEALMRAAGLKTSNLSTSRFSSAFYKQPLWIQGQRDAWYSTLRSMTLSVHLYSALNGSLSPLALPVQQYNYCRNSRCNSCRTSSCNCRCHCGCRGAWCSTLNGSLSPLALLVAAVRVLLQQLQQE